MRLVWKVVAIAATCGALVAPGSAYAVDAARAWGTINNSDGGVLLNSARLAQTESGVAQAAGAGGSAFSSVTTCGTCVTISITGDNNSVGGNNINSTNSGAITGYGYF